MRAGMLCFALGLAGLNLSAQQPFLFYGGAQNAASRSPTGLPNSGLPRGGIVVITGRNLGPATPVQATNLPLSEEFGGVRLELTAAGRTYPLYPFFVSPGEVDAIMPSGAPPGKASLRLRRGTLVSNPLPVLVEASGFGLFAVNFAGYGPAIATNFLTSAVQPLNSSAVSAAPGQQVNFWGTGLGPAAQADNLLPETVNLPTPVEVYVGGERAEVLYSGRAGTFPGLDLISIRVPAGTPPGCYVPVLARAAGSVSNSVSIAVSRPGEPCEDAHSPFSATLRKGGRMLRFFADRFSHLSELFVRSPFEYFADAATLQYSEHPANPFAYQLPDSPPPLGTCTALRQKGLYGLDLHPAFVNSGALLSAGLEGTLRAAVTRPLEAAPEFRAYQAFGEGRNTANPLLYRDGAAATVSASGFSFQLPTSGGFQWTNRAASSIVSTRRPLSISWSGGAAGDLAVIAAASSATVNDSSVIVFCVCEATRGSFSIPDYLLAALPRQNPPFLLEEAGLFIGLVRRSTAAAITAEGFSAAYGFETNWSARSVFIQ